MKTLDQHNAERKDPRLAGVLCPKCKGGVEMHLSDCRYMGMTNHGQIGRYVVCPECEYHGEMIGGSPQKESKMETR